MKRVFEHPSEPVDEQGNPLRGKRYWRSLGELENSPEFREWLEREFPQGAAELEADDVTRRNFVKLMGASLALAGFGMTGCRRPELHIVPFTKAAEWTIPGKPLFYATAMPRRGGAVPLVVRTHDGRPTKVEGNPLHPASSGGTDLFAQSSVWDLYDPDRSVRFLRDGILASEVDFLAFLDQHRAKLAEGGGAGVAFVVEETLSPTRDRLLAALRQQLPNVLWSVYEPLGDETYLEAAAQAFGPGVKPAPQFANASVVLALDSDFLSIADGDMGPAQAFMARRDYEANGENMNRLYAVEPRYTPTGSMADHRLRIQASRIGAVARAVAAKLGVAGVQDPGGWTDFQAKWIDQMVKDLAGRKGQSLVLVGKRQPVDVQLLGFAINAALGNIGKTLVGMPWVRPVSAKIGEVAAAIDAGKIHTLFVMGGNPCYNAPADLKWPELMKKVANVVRLGYSEDETSAHAHWQIPAAHYLESWGDAISADGTYVPVQPMILPLFGGWSDADLLSVLAGGKKSVGPELVQETFNSIAKPASAAEAWALFLKNGFLADSASKPQPLSWNASALGAAPAPVALESGKFEVVLPGDYRVDDGRYTNNAWLQELPDPITKLTWDNAAVMSPATAKRLGVRAYRLSAEYSLAEAGDYVEIKAGDTTVKAAAVVAPGHADDSIALSLGYGRSGVGRVGQGTGFDAYPFRTTATPYFLVNAEVRKVSEAPRPMAITQEHHSMEGRALARETTLAEYLSHPGKEANGKSFVQNFGMDAHIPPNVGIYVPPKLTDQHQWAMTIDMNICSGCAACVTACQSENNIPVVGKDQVIRGREMHWIRIDRYFASVKDDDQDPSMITQPILCQQCENAPCETVCPVNATVHSEDGLNVMAYNRCIGTRYCANNCPWKVRRFNYFDYNKRNVLARKKMPVVGDVGNLYLGPLGEKNEVQLSQMQKNPNVTVRMRGVMEKCTFCVQRIEEAKISQLVRARDSKNTMVPTDSFQVACQQACPSGAIVFGNKNDPNSKVAALWKSDRGYRQLEYLNTQPRIMYLARLKNENRDMPKAELDRLKDARGKAMGNHGHGDAHTGDHNEGAHSKGDATQGHGSHETEKQPAETHGGSH